MYCQTEVLRKCRSSNEVLKALKTLPKTLDETYQRILEGIDEKDRQLTPSALQWLVYFDQPLSVEQLAEAAILKPDVDPPFIVSDRFENPQDVLQVLSSLVTIYVDEEEEECVRIAHFSVQEYLVSGRMPSTSAHFIPMDELDSHQNITKGCLFYVDYYAQNRVSGLNSDLVDSRLLTSCAYEMESHAQACEESEYSCTDLICEYMNNESWVKGFR